MRLPDCIGPGDNHLAYPVANGIEGIFEFGYHTALHHAFGPVGLELLSGHLGNYAVVVVLIAQHSPLFKTIDQ